MKLKILFIAVVLALNFFVLNNQADAQEASFLRNYDWSGEGGEWTRVSFDLNTELSSPGWTKINGLLSTQYERFDDTNSDGRADQFSFERYAMNISDTPGCEVCPPITGCSCSPVVPDNLGQLICTDSQGNNTGPNCSISTSIPYDWSATYRITGIVATPVAPSNFSITGTGDNCSLNFSWSDLRNEDSYEIERSVDGVNFNPVASLVMNTDRWNNGVSPDIAYSYRIRAVNAAGNSSWSTITSKPLFCRAYLQGGPGGDWTSYSWSIGEELLQLGASFNWIRRESAGDAITDSESLIDTNNNGYYDTFFTRVESQGYGGTWTWTIDPFGNPAYVYVPVKLEWGCLGYVNVPIFGRQCIGWGWISVPTAIPFLLEYSIQGFRAAWVDLKINNSDGLNLEVPDTQADISWTSENVSSCAAALTINGRPAADFGLSNLWTGSKSISGSDNLGVLERGQENPGQGRQYDFSLTCQTTIGNLTTTSDRVNVDIRKYPIIDGFDCNPSAIVPPQAADCGISVRNADGGCIISGGSFSESLCSNESECLNDSILLRPSQTTDFTLTCYALDGNRFARRTISVSGGGGGVGGGGGGGGGGAGGVGSSIWKFFKSIIWREVIPR